MKKSAPPRKYATSLHGGERTNQCGILIFGPNRVQDYRGRCAGDLDPAQQAASVIRHFHERICRRVVRAGPWSRPRGVERLPLRCVRFPFYFFRVAGRAVVRSRSKNASALLARIALGATAIQALHAQATPPVILDVQCRDQGSSGLPAIPAHSRQGNTSLRRAGPNWGGLTSAHAGRGWCAAALRAISSPKASRKKAPAGMAAGTADPGRSSMR